MAIGVLLRTFLLFFICICRNILEVGCRTSLQDVQFWDAKKNESGATLSVPLILDRKLGSPRALCYNKSDFHNLTLLSLILCRRLGFLAVERIHSVSKQDFNISKDEGLEMNLQCGDQEMLLDQCYIDSLRATSCYYYLGIQCAGCNYTISMDSYEKLIIGLPDFLPCSSNAFCEWKILMERQVKKHFVVHTGAIQECTVKVGPLRPGLSCLSQARHDVITLTALGSASVSQELHFEFKIEDNNNGSNIPTTTYFKNRRIEVKWHNEDSERWILWTVNENALIYPSKLAIKSKTVILKYFAVGCYFVPRHNIQAIISTENLQQGYDHRSETVTLFYVFVSSGILIVGISILMTCLCCHRRSMKGRPRVQSFLQNRARTVPDKHEEGRHLIAAFRDFVSICRPIAYMNGERETEDLIFDLETAESLPGTSNKFMKVPDDETNGEEGNRKRCPSFEVKSGLPFSHSPAASNVVLKNINEVSSVYTANKNIVKENIVKTEDTHRQRSFLKTMRHIFHSFIMKSQCSCPYECSFLRPTADHCKELEESSLESLLDKFNKVVLSLHWSDTSCSFRSDTDYSIHAGADQKLIELVHKGTNSDFFPGQKFAEETLEKKNGSSSPELWGSPHSEAETFHSHQSSGSERSYFSVFQYSHTPTFSDPATILCQHSESSRRHGTSKHTSESL